MFTQTGKYSAKLIKATFGRTWCDDDGEWRVKWSVFQAGIQPKRGSQKGYISRSAYNHHNLNKTFQSFFWEIQ